MRVLKSVFLGFGFSVGLFIVYSVVMFVRFARIAPPNSSIDLYSLAHEIILSRLYWILILASFVGAYLIFRPRSA
jgi:hypothetical protein